MKTRVREEIIDSIKTLVISLVLALGITSIIQPTLVNGESMYPTLDNNDYLFINKLAYKSEIPKRGDIIVFKSDIVDKNTNKEKKLVKRVIARPGEHIVIKNSKVYINNKLIKENYIRDMYTEGNIDMVVPKDNLFVMGDNRMVSLDSRYSEVGTVSLKDVLGEALIRVFPFDKIGPVG